MTFFENTQEDLHNLTREQLELLVADLTMARSKLHNDGHDPHSEDYDVSGPTTILAAMKLVTYGVVWDDNERGAPIETKRRVWRMTQLLVNQCDLCPNIVILGDNHYAIDGLLLKAIDRAVAMLQYPARIN